MIHSEKFSLSLNHGERHLRLFLLFFWLGKLTNHFWKVKLNPERDLILTENILKIAAIIFFFAIFSFFSLKNDIKNKKNFKKNSNIQLISTYTEKSLKSFKLFHSFLKINLCK